MLTTEQVQQIADKRKEGKFGLNAIIENMGLPLIQTLKELRDNHRAVMDEARPK